MVMDLTEPIPALVLTPRRLLRLAMFVGASGVAALLVAVGVLVWTYSGLRPDSQEQTVPADMSSKPVAAAPAEALAPEPVPAPVAAPPAPAAAPAAGANAEILRNPAMAAIAPTAATGSSSAPVSSSGYRPGHSDGQLAQQQRADRRLERRRLDRSACRTSTGPASSWPGFRRGDATYRRHHRRRDGDREQCAELAATTRINLLNTLILANSGFYGAPLWPSWRWPAGPARPCASGYGPGHDGRRASADRSALAACASAARPARGRCRSAFAAAATASTGDRDRYPRHTDRDRILTRRSREAFRTGRPGFTAVVQARRLS